MSSLQSSNRSPFAPLNRALFATKVLMIWERLLPALFPYVLLAIWVAVAAQWGLFQHLSTPAHASVLIVGFVLTFIASVRAARRFRMPGFTEINNRLALDNGLKPERLLAMRHEISQPPLKLGKAKAGIAEADPFALRYVALVAAIFGFILLGPVPMERIMSAFVPGITAQPFTLASRN
ncbi:DUF4175 family protein [Asticcacaulis sp. EMRT-3]|uniref:DUF4175 family protein n=1 Tax=Asticcacaulis sp. EMRT-3 TaxID=3040349 RepID=UPI0024AEFD8D|nr:DUF4175 family protein [Asticcacaulis sp. EMRT-3]MDI7776045.1 DUF4175 family protein [Asticcacaulis sp. EMRT-3]